MIHKLRETLGGTWLRVLLAVIAAMFIYWLYQQNIDLANVARWTREHWLWLIIVTGILYVLITVNTAALKGTAGVLKNMVIGTALLMLLSTSPLGEWALGASQTAVKCPNASETSEQVCVLNTKLSDPVMPQASNKRLCLGPDNLLRDGLIEVKHLPVGDGRFYWQFRATKDEQRIVYQLKDKC